MKKKSFNVPINVLSSEQAKAYGLSENEVLTIFKSDSNMKIKESFWDKNKVFIMHPLQTLKCIIKGEKCCCCGKRVKASKYWISTEINGWLVQVLSYCKKCKKDVEQYNKEHPWKVDKDDPNIVYGNFIPFVRSETFEK